MKYQRYHFDTVTSTNDFAKELVQNTDCVVVTADFQTKGRGRNQNTWLGEFGQNVYISIGIKHNQIKKVEEVAYFQWLGALSVLNTLQNLCCSVQFRLKYPNDVYAKLGNGDYKKISGILVEHQFLGEFCISTVLGIGINVKQTLFPSEIKNNATSLKLLGCEHEVEQVIDKLIESIEANLSLLPFEIYEQWIKELNILGKEITLINTGQRCIVKNFDEIGQIAAKEITSNQIIIIGNGDTIRYDLS